MADIQAVLRAERDEDLTKASARRCSAQAAEHRQETQRFR